LHIDLACHRRTDRRRHGRGNRRRHGWGNRRRHGRRHGSSADLYEAMPKLNVVLNEFVIFFQRGELALRLHGSSLGS
jgi:hypothetical protein